MARYNLDDYATVQSRLDQFHKDHPDGRIETQVVSITGDHLDVVIKAAIYLDKADADPKATGIAQESKGPVGANIGSWVENCETSAIGRALANMDYSGSINRPSREEMVKQERVESNQTQYTHYEPAKSQTFQQARASAPSGPRLATEPQKNYITRLAEQAGWEMIEVDEELAKAGESMSGLTSQGASDFIEYLKALVASQKAG